MTDYQKQIWTYRGRVLVKGKAAPAYAWADASDEVRCYPKQIVQAAIGATFEITMDANGSVFTAGVNAPVHLGRIESVDPAWVARDLAAVQGAAQKSLATKAAKIEPLESILAPLREISSKLTVSERRALAARIMEVLWT